MIYEVCSVFDNAAGVFGRPVFVPAIGVMLRSFGDEVNRHGDDNPMNGHPEDFTLYHLGQFDDNSGTFDVFPQPKRLTSAREVMIPLS